MFSLFFIAFGAVGFGLALAMIITRQKAPTGEAMIPPEDESLRDSELGQSLAIQDLFKLGEKLCEENHITIKERIRNSDTESYWIGDSTNDFFFGTYVLGFLQTETEHPFATMSDILEFKDFLKSVGAAKGFFFTNGYFTKDVHQPLEGPKVALFNKAKSLSEMKRLKIS